jgi:hypothetical protein
MNSTNLMKVLLSERPRSFDDVREVLNRHHFKVLASMTREEALDEDLFDADYFLVEDERSTIFNVFIIRYPVRSDEDVQVIPDDRESELDGEYLDECWEDEPF